MKHFAGRCTFGIATVLAAAAACAQTYPAKAVRFVVPFVAGGPTDIQGRMLGEKLTQRLGQQFIIDNRGGANGRPRAVNRVPACGMRTSASRDARR